jgi:hypothetical protein
MLLSLTGFLLIFPLWALSVVLPIKENASAIPIKSPVTVPVKPEIKFPPAENNNEDDDLEQPLLRRQALISVAMARGIVGRELKQLLGHSSHETGRWEYMSEMGSTRYFRRYDPPGWLGKSLGNIILGDGERYRGRGHLMLTGRANYREAGRALDLPLEDNPDLMLDPYISAMVTVWWWQDRVQPRIKNWNSTVAIANIINPGNTDQRAMNSRHRKVYEQGLELGLVARR